MELPKETEIRMRAIEAAAAVALPSDDIGNLLVHADWIASYVETGKMPQIDSTESSIAGRFVEAT